MWTTDQLPTDIDALQAPVAATRAERDAAIASATLRSPRATMRCRRWIGSATSCGSCNAWFGRCSEKLDPEQLLLA